MHHTNISSAAVEKLDGPETVKRNLINPEVITLMNNIIDEVLWMDQIINKVASLPSKDSIDLTKKILPISNKIYTKVKIKKS